VKVWTEAARTVGGTVDIPSGFSEGTVYGMSASVKGTEVVVDFSGATKDPMTRIRAAAPAAGELSLSIRRGRVSSVDRAFGSKDVEIGDPDFDAVFVVTTNDESVARSWLTPDVREPLFWAPSYSFDLSYSPSLSQPGGVVAFRPGLEQDSTELAAAIRAVAALSSGGRGGAGKSTYGATATSRVAMPPAALEELRRQSTSAIASDAVLLGLVRFLLRKPGPALDIQAMIAVACAVAVPVLAVCLRRGLLGTWASENDSGLDWRAFRRRHLASFAVLQGTVLFCVVEAVRTRRTEPLHAALLPLVTLVLQLPRRNEV
jgi:hypothetical protein